jgi:diguanylate cyclase (GGDEF)-like protein
LATTPAGWALVVWMCWGSVPHTQIVLWLAAFVLAWVLDLGILQWVIRARPKLAEHNLLLFGVAGLDGFAWGLVTWLLMGFQPLLDPWLAAVLCGVSAVNAPVYITYIRAYYALIGTLWVVMMLAAAMHADRADALTTAVGLTIFFALIVYYMQGIARRVLEGIRLQFTNASLAQQLRAALALVEVDAATDPLTGQPNRRALEALLHRQIELAVKVSTPFAVLMLDIDYFKLVNDTHGHGVGDHTLRAFAFRIRESLRQGDVCARFGGEEFVVVLPNTVFDVALEIAERLRSQVADEDLLTSPPIKATVSIGLAVFRPGQSSEEVLRQADAALYLAKQGGRNQVRAAAG